MHADPPPFSSHSRTGPSRTMRTLTYHMHTACMCNSKHARYMATCTPCLGSSTSRSCNTLLVAGMITLSIRATPKAQDVYNTDVRRGIRRHGPATLAVAAAEILSWRTAAENSQDGERQRSSCNTSDA
jgi:hypothetical protein